MLPSRTMALRHSTLLFLASLVSLSFCADTSAQWKTLKPQVNPTRELVSLDGLWNFALVSSDDINDDQAWTSVIPSELQVPVPASYNDIFVDAELRDPIGWVFYQRQVTVPSSWEERRNILRFDAVTHEAQVYINDQHVGGHIGGYTPFEVDVTDIVAPGEQFRLTVAVSNILTWHTIPPGKVETNEFGIRHQTYNHDFYNYAGIARSVWFYSVSDVYINDISVTTEVQDQGSRGSVNFAVSTNKKSNSTQARISLLDEDGNKVSEASQLQGTLDVDSPTLWQPGAAYLYQLRVELLSGNGGEPVDIYELPVGIRSVEVEGNQFLINGEPFYFKGFGKHEDSAIRGKGYDPAYMIHDFNLMNWMGANSFRTSHYPYAEEVLEYADRHGIVVIDETAAVGLNPALFGVEGEEIVAYSPETISNETQATHAQAIRELVHRDKNHPSIVMWCIANEPAAHEEGAREYFEPLVDLTRELDPTRPITFTSEGNALPDTDLIVDLMDVVSLNRYYGWYFHTGDLASAEQALEAELQDWHDVKGKPIIMSEYGADTIAGLHAIDDVLFTEEFQSRYLDFNHQVFDRIGSVVGEHVWNFADFQTPSNSVRRVDGNKKGVFTRERRPKAAAHFLRARWTGDMAKAGAGYSSQGE